MPPRCPSSTPCALLLTAVALVGCGGEGELGGSLDDVYRLGHDDVRARLYDGELSIEYARDDGSVPVRVSLRLDEVTPKSGGSYDLGDHGSITGQLSDGTEIPPFIDGRLNLDTYQDRQGGEVVGTFTGKFDGVRDTLNLRGEFDTTLETIDWPMRPELPDAGAPVAPTEDAGP